MACWVVPSIAAELWGISVEKVNEAIREGRASSKVEHGFTLVDVAPHSPQIEPPRRRREERPATFMSLTADELLALYASDEVSDEADASSSDERFDWRESRTRIARERRAPAAVA